MPQAVRKPLASVPLNDSPQLAGSPWQIAAVTPSTYESTLRIEALRQQIGVDKPRRLAGERGP